MKTLTIQEQEAKKFYPAAAGEFKARLEEIFGKETLDVKITDRIKSFEDACQVLGVNSASVLPYSDNITLLDDEKAIQAFAKLQVIARALNEGWKPDWNDEDQYKYYPYFQTDGGFDFSVVIYTYWHSSTYVGSRLCFRSSELALYAGTQFLDIYNDFLTLK